MGVELLRTSLTGVELLKMTLVRAELLRMALTVELLRMSLMGTELLGMALTAELLKMSLTAELLGIALTGIVEVPTDAAGMVEVTGTVTVDSRVVVRTVVDEPEESVYETTWLSTEVVTGVADVTGTTVVETGITTEAVCGLVVNGQFVMVAAHSEMVR